VDTGSKAGSPGTTERAKARFDEAAKARFHEAMRLIEARGEDQIVRDVNRIGMPEQVMLAFALGNFSAAFFQALGQRAADSAAKRVGDLVLRLVRKKGKPDEYQIGARDGSSAMITITADTPDEARLALLDLDVTADAVRGKLLRWDGSASAWRPDDDQ